MRNLVSIFALAVLIVTSLTSCFDPEPGELIARCFLNDRERSCVVMVYGSNGKQIQEVSTDSNGVGYIEALVPDTYTLKFKDISGNMYPAVATVKLVSGASLPVNIELNNEDGMPNS